MSFLYIIFILFTFLNVVFTKNNKYGIDGPFNKVIATPCGSFLDKKYACNVKIKDTDMVAAISNYQFSYSYHKNNSYTISDVCNKKIKIKNIGNKKSIIVYIKDNYLNGKSGSIDLTTKSWNILASKKDIHRGHMIVDWNWI